MRKSTANQLKKFEPVTNIKPRLGFGYRRHVRMVRDPNKAGASIAQVTVHEVDPTGVASNPFKNRRKQLKRLWNQTPWHKRNVVKKELDRILQGTPHGKPQPIPNS